MGRGRTYPEAIKESRPAVKRTDQPTAEPTPRARAVHTAARACNDHQQQPTTHTLHRMQDAVDHARNLGATTDEIRAARNGR